ncbi:molybdopterin guanine dinucleotide synthesis [Gemmobacter sp.]|uniref:molybdopterin guanine dinucleotide synthesis n=1 Tax=Gemmobacter sp. TaxID=1898957 RepID=UPI002AFEF1C7|nr:molybdopterin guanine dinucleotide synthesis [Gemmobacter sp.]
MRFDRIAMLDWSSARGPKRGKDSIWLGTAGAGASPPLNLPTRASAEAALRDLVRAPGRLMIGVDIGFAWPAGFAHGLTGQPRALAVWDWLASRIAEGPAGPNHRSVAAEANRAFAGGGPFWGDGTRAGTPGLSRTRPDLPPGMAWHRGIEMAARFGRVAPKSMFQLAGIGAVGAQALTCIPVLHRLCSALPPGDIAVWPFQPVDHARVVLTEVYFSLLAHRLAEALPQYPCLDAAQVDLLAQAVMRLSDQGALAAIMAPQAPADQVQDEGWILGAGHHALLQQALG